MVDVTDVENDHEINENEEKVENGAEEEEENGAEDKIDKASNKDSEDDTEPEVFNVKRAFFSMAHLTYAKMVAAKLRRSMDADEKERLSSQAQAEKKACLEDGFLLAVAAGGKEDDKFDPEENISQNIDTSLAEVPEEKAQDDCNSQDEVPVKVPEEAGKISREISVEEMIQNDGCSSNNEQHEDITADQITSAVDELNNDYNTSDQTTPAVDELKNDDNTADHTTSAVDELKNDYNTSDQTTPAVDELKNDDNTADHTTSAVDELKNDYNTSDQTTSAVDGLKNDDNTADQTTSAVDELKNDDNTADQTTSAVDELKNEQPVICDSNAIFLLQIALIYPHQILLLLRNIIHSLHQTNTQRKVWTA